MLRWPPDAFWRATTWEVLRAYEGYAVSKGAKKRGKLSDKDVARLRAELEEAKRKEREKNGNLG